MDYFKEFNKDLNTNDKLKAIESWQESEMHPLTCINCGKPMYGDIVEGEVVLKCKCGYIQISVPKSVYYRYKRLMI